MNTAGTKWLELLLDIVMYEVDHNSDGQLLSDGAKRLVKRFPVSGRAFILCAGSVITLHLASVLDERWDPMSQYFWRAIRGR
jgi:hypothetical protein